mgnify:FL=1
MSLRNLLFLLIFLIPWIGALIYALYVGNTLRALERMLDDVIRGEFTPSHYNESRLSRLENKLDRFLAVSALSRANIEADRTHITQTIGDISHQTKTPIANIRLYSELLQEQELTPATKNLAEQISTQTDKLDFLIQALVKTSRLETGVVQLHPEINSVEQLTQSLYQTFLSKAQAHGLTLSQSCPAEATACFDPKWTAEALGNFVDNAIKYTPSGGTVSISVQVYELFCRIDVADTGIGIPESEQAQVFQRFYRGSQVQQGDGVGIGLYLARQILSSEQGYIKLSSTPGKGSVFSAFLPRLS